MCMNKNEQTNSLRSCEMKSYLRSQSSLTLLSSLSLLSPQHQQAAQAAGQRQQMSRITMRRMRSTATGMPMARPSTAASVTVKYVLVIWWPNRIRPSSTGSIVQVSYDLTYPGNESDNLAFIRFSRHCVPLDLRYSHVVTVTLTVSAN